MTPECCKNCPSLLEDGTCTANGKACIRWQEWFTKEWAGIRLSAEKIKENKRRRLGLD